MVAVADAFPNVSVGACDAIFSNELASDVAMAVGIIDSAREEFLEIGFSVRVGCTIEVNMIQAFVATKRVSKKSSKSAGKTAARPSPTSVSKETR